MTERLERAELVGRVAQRVHRHVETVGEVVDATLAEIWEALKRGQSVSLRDFGSVLRATGAGPLGLQVQPLAAPAEAVRLVVDVPRRVGAVANPEQRYLRISQWVMTGLGRARAHSYRSAAEKQRTPGALARPGAQPRRP